MQGMRQQMIALQGTDPREIVHPSSATAGMTFLPMTSKRSELGVAGHAEFERLTKGRRTFVLTFKKLLRAAACAHRGGDNSLSARDSSGGIETLLKTT
jgi:hypothetical protein